MQTFERIKCRTGLLLLVGLLAAVMTVSRVARADELGEYWGTAEAESKYYRIVDIPFPDDLSIEAGSFGNIIEDLRLGCCFLGHECWFYIG